MRNILQKKWFTGLGVAFLIVAFVLVGLDSLAGGSSDSTSGNNNPSASSTAETQNQPSSTDNSTGGNGQATADVQSAVVAAANANSSLSGALFLPDAALKGVVAEVVTPTMQNAVVLTYTAIAQGMAKSLGYPTVYEANKRSYYYSQTQKYRVESVTDTTAKIWLYTVLHFTTVDGKRYRSPSISIINMVKSGDTWLYVNSVDPPKNQVPTPQTGLSYRQTVARFQPYLRGFSNYVDLGE